MSSRSLSVLSLGVVLVAGLQVRAAAPPCPDDRACRVEVSTEVRLVSVSDACLARLGVALDDSTTLDDRQVLGLLEAVQSDPSTSVMQVPKMTLFSGQRATVRIEGEDSFCLFLLPAVSPDDRVVTLQLSLDVRRAATKSSASIAETLQLTDGATALLGGWTEVREVRREFRTPVLADMPGLGKLFRVVGYGKERAHVFVLVTPRVVVAPE